MISVVGIRHRHGGDSLLPRTLRPRLADLSLGLLSSEDLLTCPQGDAGVLAAWMLMWPHQVWGSHQGGWCWSEQREGVA